MERAGRAGAAAAREGAAGGGAPPPRGAAGLPARRPARARARARDRPRARHGARGVPARTDRRLITAMRVLMLNAFHWLKGGVERTVFDETAWLERAGHEVAHFAIRDSHNLPSPFADHFAPAADRSESTPAWRQLAHLPRALWSALADRAAAGPLRADAAPAPTRWRAATDAVRDR